MQCPSWTPIEWNRITRPALRAGRALGAALLTLFVPKAGGQIAAIAVSGAIGWMALRLPLQGFPCYRGCWAIASRGRARTLRSYSPEDAA